MHNCTVVLNLHQNVPTVCLHIIIIKLNQPICIDFGISIWTEDKSCVSEWTGNHFVYEKRKVSVLLWRISKRFHRITKDDFEIWRKLVSTQSQHRSGLFDSQHFKKTNERYYCLVTYIPFCSDYFCLIPPIDSTPFELCGNKQTLWFYCRLFFCVE